MKHFLLDCGRYGRILLTPSCMIPELIPVCVNHCIQMSTSHYTDVTLQRLRESYNNFRLSYSILTNALTLAAFQNESSIHPPLLLLLCLATTEPCVSLISPPVCVSYILDLQNWSFCHLITVYLECSVSFEH